MAPPTIPTAVLLSCVGSNVSRVTMGKHLAVLSHTCKKFPFFDSVYPLSEISPREVIRDSDKDLHMKIFIQELFVTAQNGNNWVKRNTNNLEWLPLLQK